MFDKNTYIKNLIREAFSVSPNYINDAINNKYEVEISYVGEHEREDKGFGKGGKLTKDGSGKRLIQPHAYGLTKAGNPVIRAFQPYGDTLTKEPAWKFFRMDRITSWKPYKDRHFEEAPDGYNAEGTFNKDGDKTMTTVFNIASFSDEPHKTDSEKRIDKFKQSVNSPINVKDYVGQNPTQNEPTKNDNIESGPVEKEPTKKEEEVFKTETEKNMQRLRDQLNNPKYISDVIKQNKLKDSEFGSGPVVDSNQDEENNVDNTTKEENNDEDLSFYEDEL